MNIIVRANEVIFEEVKGEDMCEALRELFKDEIEAATNKVRVEVENKVKSEVKKDTLLELLRDGLLTTEEVATRLNVTEAEVKEMLAN